MDLTIIIPMYNAEKTIKYCLESIMNQIEKELLNYEVIIVDDGSKDNSINVAQKYILDKKNFKIIKKKNGGVSSARNEGLNNAKGKYIWFIDSDDLIRNDSFSIIKEHMQSNIDIFKFNYTLEKIPNKLFIKENKIKKDIKYNFLNTYAFNSVCTQIVKRDLIESNNIKFKEEYSYGEDYLFNLELYTKTNNIVIKNDYIYTYKKTSNSITRNNSIKSLEKKLNDCIFVYNQLYSYAQKLNLEESDIKYRINNEIIHLLKLVPTYENFNTIIKNDKIKKNLISLNTKSNIKLFYHKITCKTKIVKQIKEILKWFGF